MATVGSACVNLSSSGGVYTVCLFEDAATEDSTVDDIQCYAASNVTGLEVGSHEDTSPPTYEMTCHGNCSGADMSATSGACRTLIAGTDFTAYSCDNGEYVGYYVGGGAMERTSSSGAGNWYNTGNGDQIATDNVYVYLWNGGGTSSLLQTVSAASGQSITVGLITENETLFSPSVIFDQSATVGALTENESLFSLASIVDAVIGVGALTENESLFSALVGTGGISVGLITENESLFSPSVSTTVTITTGAVTENESLFPVTPANTISVSVGQVLESEVLSAATPIPGGISTVVGLITENESLFSVAAVALGGVFNAIGYLPTGGTVTIELINVEDDTVISIDDSSCVESNTIAGVYLWDTSKLTVQPTGNVQYGWRMTDGTNFDGGDIVISAADSTKIARIHDLLDNIEGSLDHQEVMRILLSGMAGLLSGADGVNVKFRDLADTKDRIDATVDAFGNRSAVTLDAS